MRYEYNSRIWLIILFIGAIIGVTTAKYVANGPFSDFSANPVFDILKVLIFILISTLILYFVSNKVSERMARIILLALFIRIATVFIMSFFGVLPYLYDNVWERAADELLPDWYSGNFHFNIGEGISYYSKLSTIIYFIIGRNPIYMQLLNVFFGTLTIYYIFLIGKLLFNQRIAYKAAFIMAIWPTHVFYTSMQMRESLAIFFLVALAYYFMKWIRFIKLKYIVIVGIMFVFSIFIRAQNAVLISLLLFPFILYYAWSYSNKYLKVVIFIPIGILILIGMAILNSSGYLSYLNFDYIASEMNYRTDGGSAYLQWMSYDSIFDVILFAPIRFIYFVYSPFIWQITDLPQAVAFVESLVLIIMSFYILKGFKHIWNDFNCKKELFFIIMFCVGGLVANSIIDSNVGTALRHKLQYIFIFIILFSATWDNRRRKKFGKDN